MTNVNDAKMVTARDYAIGLLSGGDYAQAAISAERDETFAAEVAHTEAMLASVALQFPAEDVSDQFFDRLEARIDSLHAPSAKCIVARASEGLWVEWLPGARIKVLHRKPEIRRQTFLLELAPGARADTHAHDDDEECYVISGDIWFGETELKNGDYHLAQKGAMHGAVRSVGGCLCLIISAMD
jgi:quercetin dioxygenase-like cupin family protein